MNFRIGRRYFAAVAVAGVSLLSAAAWADNHAASDPVATSHDQHPMSNDADVRRTEALYVIPEVTLLRDDGKQVNRPEH